MKEEKEADDMSIEIIFVAVFGIIIGSFLNVCIYRIPRKGHIVFPPSHCTNCKSKLRCWDLIPILSYVLLKGRCRYCGDKISLRYPAIEILTAVLFEFIYFRYGMSIEFLIYLLIVCILIIMSFIDIEHMIIPNRIVIVALLGGGCLFIYNALYPMEIYLDNYWWNPLLGMVVGSGFLLIVSCLGSLVYKSEEVIGMGDVKILAPIGIFLGWRITIVALYLSVILAGIASLTLILLGYKKRKSRVVLGPFIGMGTFIAIIYGQQILNFWIRNVCK